MRTKKFLAAVLLACICFSLHPSVRSLFGEMGGAQFEDILAGEEVQAYTTFGQDTDAILPDYTIIKDLARRTRDLDYAFSVSVSSFVEYPQSMKALTDSEKYLDVLNMAQSISTIKGITYLSHSSGYKPEVLFSDAYFVENEKSRKKIEDPVCTDIEFEQITRYAWIKDSRFGGNLYKVNYMCYRNEIFLEISNVNAMKYMGFKCLDADSLHLYLDATLADEGVIISGLSVIYNQEPQAKVLFVTVDLPSAFMKRICSLKDWFTEKILSY